MKPAVYNIQVRRGDSWGPIFVTLPDLTSLGGFSSLTGTTLEAKVMFKNDDIADLQTEILDADDRYIKLWATPTETVRFNNAGLTWYLRLSKQDWARTVLGGKVILI
jgi:hypothetical protein